MPKHPTIRRDSVFRSTDPDRSDQPTNPPDRPAQGAPEAERSMRQTAVWLSDDELEWLDQECRKLRRSGWRSINRSIVIRAILESHIGIEPDYADTRSERGLSDRFRAQYLDPARSPA